MAAYNGEKFIAAQIESILSRLAQNDELIISYDTSTDGTLNIIQRYSDADRRVKWLSNDTPGIVGNFNNALSACSKDVIFISDQDDLWVGEKRDVVMDVLNDTGADLAIHNVVHIDVHNEVISRPLFEMYGIGPGKLRNFAMPRYSGCCMAFPKSTMRMIFPMPTDVINYDHWIGMSCELFGKVVFIDDVLLHHRLHEGNVTPQRRPLGVVFQQRSRLLRALMGKRKELDR